ncbi:MAG TPA: ABC transporter ATP-binding protein [Mesotoga prima]|uniref:ABC transporter ATP-binding protein n=2 Tax=Mesotoga TaxID=1184396 RepID=UPI002C842A50|nr:ABC transporter ATP-binding protein [Mesotoga prima]HOP37882.1 ABC transporter ATP-binding protein [Mesotoga prima]HPE53645.1 ABC transporter ATP-binding protein [Mesotoga prima]HPJ32455.1 ABC transporter ATP-binding protein [Mesotoga prima]HPQ91564.1 ABC transporter ATP-binding protein [Mesotoga prima]
MNGIVTSNLVKRYGSFEALKGVSLSIEDGDLYCLLGPNGAGKSTLIRILTGLMKPTSGEVNIAGLDMKRDLKKIREKVGLVSERVILYDRLTPVENLLFFSSMLRIEKRTALKRINSLLEKVDMIEWKDKPIRVFSTGMKQRVNFVRALLHEPSILFMDEPTLGLDPHSTRTIRNMVRELNESGRTIVLTTHIMSEAENIAKSVGIMNKGKLITTGKLEAIRASLNRDRLTITVKNRPEVPFESIDGYMSDSRLNGVVRIDFRPGTTMESVLPKILQMKLEVIDVDHIKPSLEDVFVELTGEKS